ncbi:MAG: hypothetical protein PHC52_00645 [Syntrophales bacterium]|nr:hypothetical protein [Syntrophales bacterium]
MTYDEWRDQGNKLFGPDRKKWPFECPSCGYVATAEDYLALGAPLGAIGFSCIGRFWKDQSKVQGFPAKKNGRPCNYAGGGLFRINPVEVDGEFFFAFAHPPEIRPGVMVHYHPIIGGEADGKVYEVLHADKLTNGHHVAWLKGKPGFVAVEALTLVKTKGEDNAKRSEG